MTKKCDYQLRGIDPEVWKRVKILAARSGLTIRQLIIDALKEYLIKHD